jgi:hypothetical protein
MMPYYLMKEIDELFTSEAGDDLDAQEVAAMWGAVVIRRLTSAEELQITSTEFKGEDDVKV